MMIKTALILTILTLVSIIITRIMVRSMKPAELLFASVKNEWPRKVLIITSITILFSVGTVIMWIIAIATY